MEGIYFYGDYQRWNLGWENPNPAGAFIATLIPWLWGLAYMASSGNRLSSWKAIACGVLLLSLEIALWFLLCKTYSRGALVAMMPAGLLLIFLVWLLRNWKGASLLFLPRVSAVAILLIATGFFSRIAPSYVAQDASAMNRLTLWKGGLEMIASSPWKGWGVGNSGPAFMHWFQPLESEEAYAGMVNSYLHVGVERGLPFLALMLLCMLTVVFLAGGVLVSECKGVFRPTRFRCGSAVLLAALCSLVAFMAANVFSTLWIFENLWWVPGFSALSIMAMVGYYLRGRVWRLLLVSLAAACVGSTLVSGALWVVGSTTESGISVSLSPDGSVNCQSSEGAGTQETVLLPDETVLGENWGKEVRRLAASDPSLLIRAVETTELRNALDDSVAGVWVACGAHCNETLRSAAGTPNLKLILVHPLGKPALDIDKVANVKLYVPALDTTGAGRRWRGIARKGRWEVVISEGVGQDVRRNWPTMFMENDRSPLQR